MLLQIALQIRSPKQSGYTFSVFQFGANVDALFPSDGEMAIATELSRSYHCRAVTVGS